MTPQELRLVGCLFSERRRLFNRTLKDEASWLEVLLYAGLPDEDRAAYFASERRRRFRECLKAERKHLMILLFEAIVAQPLPWNDEDCKQLGLCLAVPEIHAAVMNETARRAAAHQPGNCGHEGA